MEDTKMNIEVEQFKLRRLIKKLNEAKVTGSVISLIIPKAKKISDYTSMLAEEFGKASNIKDRTNRQSVEDAIQSALNRLKLINKVPPNGLVYYNGVAIGEDGKERKYNIDLEPYRPINTSLYSCDNKFHTEDLIPLLENQKPFGFIIVDGSGSLYAKLQGDSKEVLQRFTVELPQKHGRGGQSSVRFARLRLEKRHNYLRKVTEVAVQCFIEKDLVNVQGLILAGCGDFKSELSTTQMLDQRLAAQIVQIVDVSYGGDNGLNQAIELSQECMQDVKFVQEKQLISNFFEEVAQDTGQVIYGVQDTLQLLEDGTIEQLICFENIDSMRVTLKHQETGSVQNIYVQSQDFEKDRGIKESDSDYEYVEGTNLAEWLAENYSKFGAELNFVTDQSAEGFQFIKGFGGIGGFLRYKFEIEHLIQKAEEWTCDDDAFI